MLWCNAKLKFFVVGGAGKGRGGGWGWSGYNICVEVGGELSISIKWNGHSQTKNPVSLYFRFQQFDHSP